MIYPETEKCQPGSGPQLGSTALLPFHLKDCDMCTLQLTMKIRSLCSLLCIHIVSRLICLRNHGSEAQDDCHESGIFDHRIMWSMGAGRRELGRFFVPPWLVADIVVRQIKGSGVSEKSPASERVRVVIFVLGMQRDYRTRYAEFRARSAATDASGSAEILFLLWGGGCWGR